MGMSINKWLQRKNSIQHGARNNFELTINCQHTDKQLFAYLLLISYLLQYFKRETDDAYINSYILLNNSLFYVH